MTIQEILNSDNLGDKKALFIFNSTNSDEEIRVKFNIWARWFFPNYFTSDDCRSHKQMDLNNIALYRSSIDQFVNIAFRGFSKTARTKLFLAFVIANDTEHKKRFMRCLSADLDNAKQSVTDIYNMFIQARVRELYPEIFVKTESKREETMSSFTTSTGVKMIAKQMIVDQRGKIMEDAKSDLDWYDDIETKKTIMSAITTYKIGIAMEEARTGLAIGGGSIYTANYFSEAGNIHELVVKKVPGKIVQITPLVDDFGKITWPQRYDQIAVDKMKATDKDFEGERLCKPASSKDVYFDREKLNKMVAIQPIKDIAGFKQYKIYNQLHRYAGGHDVALGVGLDSSTSVFIDFDTIPAQVVGVYESNTIAPEAFGQEIYNEGNIFGGCLLGVENNKYDQCILKAKQLGAKLFMRPGKTLKASFQTPSEFGWNTNALTKSQMMTGLKEAIESGLLELNDENLINEVKGYTRNDIMDLPPDVRLTTRHFDLLTALAIAWQMLNYAKPKAIRSQVNQNQTVTNPAI